MQQYTFNPKRSLIYLPEGGKIKCPLWAVAAVELDVVDRYWVLMNFMETKERIRAAFFTPELHLKHINIDCSDDEMAIYTTGGTRKGITLWWKGTPICHHPSMNLNTGELLNTGSPSPRTAKGITSSK